MTKIKEFFQDVKSLYSPVELILLLLFITALNFGYFFMISKHLITSIVVGIIGMLFFFIVFNVPNKKLNSYQEQLGSLLKYVTNMTFFLQSGENVLYSLTSTKPTLDDEVQKYLQITIETLENDALLVTDHFELYEFPSLDQFHQNLSIKYDKGGDPKELFGLIQQNMMFELKKRDELHKKRKGFALNVYTLLALVASITIILRFMVTDLWDIFLNFSFIGIGILVFVQFLMFLNLYFLQRKMVDISVRI